MEDLHNIQCKTKLLTKRYLYLQYTLKYEQQRIRDQCAGPFYKELS